MANESNEFDVLCDEAHKNAVEDRKLLKEHQKKLREFMENEGGSAIVVATDAFVKTSDIITKLNSQLIHLAELSLKKSENDGEGESEEFDDDEIEEMYDSVAKVETKVEDDEPN